MGVRGFLAGGVWGVVVCGVAVAAASLVNPPPKLPQAAEADEVTPENTREIDSTVSVEPGDGPSIDSPPEIADAPETPEAERPVAAEDSPDIVEEPAADSAPSIDTAAAEEPVQADTAEDDPVAEIDTADSAQEAADDVAIAEADPVDDQTAEGAETAAPDPDTLDDVAPVATAENLVVPDAPDESVAPDTSTAADAAPATPDAPEVVTAEAEVPAPLEGSATTPAAPPQVAATATLQDPVGTAESGANAAADVAPVTTTAQPIAPAVPDTDTVATDINAPVEEPNVVVEAPAAEEAPAAAQDAPDLVAVNDSTPLTPQSPVSPATPTESDDVPEEIEGSNPVLAQAPEAPVVSVLPGGSSGVRVNRLTGGATEEETAASETEDDAVAPLPDDAPAVLRYAAAAENPDNLPELSVILADDGSFEGAVAAISGLPFPVSVMLNPSAEGAGDRMAAYRSAGIEVGLLVSLPPAATAGDVAIYFEAALGRLPEAFAVLDATGDTQGDADVIRQTISVLAEDGQGLIAVPRGLNTAPRVAAEAGVAAGVIFRDLDGEGQDARAIQRFMDQAAFRAGQTSGVMLLGRLRPETISALTRWGTGSSRADQVAVMPASALLTAE